jgi:hypothetical protein
MSLQRTHESHPIERQIQRQIENAKYCADNRDCVKLPSVCPFGCCQSVNHNEANFIYNSFNRYYDFGRCSHACRPCGQPVCHNGRCVESSWSHISGFADIASNRAELRGYEGTSFHYDIDRNTLFVEHLEFRDQTLPMLMDEIDRLAKERQVNRINLHLRNSSQRWPITYGYKYLGHDQAIDPTTGRQMNSVVDFIYFKNVRR